jgi:hypothetical protein
MMEKKEMDELAAMGQALVEIERQFSDLDGITMRQLSELANKYALTVIQVMAIISLAKWNRLYRKFNEIGNNPPREISPHAAILPPVLQPRDRDDEIIDLSEKREGPRPRIEFL